MSQTRHFITAAEAAPPFFAGIDLGGTNIKVGVVDNLGRPLSWLTLPTEIDRGAEDAARRMGAAVQEAVGRAGLEPAAVARVGLGSPGTMDIPAGRLIKPVNLKGWDDFPIRDRVACHAGLPVTFANDADAAAYGEFWVGSGREFHSMVLFTLGTGIGCGIILGDACLSGEHSHGGECGHLIINFQEDARLCGCGRRGHLEAYASATAVIKRTREALAAGRKSSLADRLAAGKALTPKLLAAEAEVGDDLSVEIILDTAAYLGIGVVNLMHTVDPNGVLLGGAMTFGGHETETGRRFLARVRDEVRRRAFPVLAERTTIDFASLGGDAGYIGAAGLARLDHLKHTTAC
ncbi:MAG: ROK family protein [Thermoguttaceae bacterium]|jgi:glucokinase